MNAGTRSGCMADSLIWIEVIDHEGKRRRIERADLQPGYRSMGLRSDWIVLGGCFRLKPVPKGELKAGLRELMQQRKQTQPLGWPSAGCVFKNPPGHSAGALIEQSGMKGCRIGSAQVSEKHANWILNRGGARAGDVLELMERMEAQVFEKFGVRLERELKVFVERECLSTA